MDGNGIADPAPISSSSRTIATPVSAAAARTVELTDDIFGQAAGLTSAADVVYAANNYIALPIVNASNDLISDNTTVVGGYYSLTGPTILVDDPQLAALNNNGGATQTMAFDRAAVLPLAMGCRRTTRGRRHRSARTKEALAGRPVLRIWGPMLTPASCPRLWSRPSARAMGPRPAGPR